MALAFEEYEAREAKERQAKDDQLRKLADRIQARATRRCGELLKQIPAAHGANQNIQEGALPIVTRESAATDAGLSERQRTECAGSEEPTGRRRPVGHAN